MKKSIDEMSLGIQSVNEVYLRVLTFKGREDGSKTVLSKYHFPRFVDMTNAAGMIAFERSFLARWFELKLDKVNAWLDEYPDDEVAHMFKRHAVDYIGETYADESFCMDKFAMLYAELCSGRTLDVSDISGRKAFSECVSDIVDKGVTNIDSNDKKRFKGCALEVLNSVSASCFLGNPVYKEWTFDRVKHMDDCINTVTVRQNFRHDKVGRNIKVDTAKVVTALLRATLVETI